MKFMRGAALVGGVMALVGCGSAGSFNGQVDERSLAVQDAIVTQWYGNDGQQIGVALILSDQPNLCDTLRKGRVPKSSTSFRAGLLRLGNSGTLGMDTGEFLVITQAPNVTGNFAIGQFQKTDASCSDVMMENRAYAKSGSIEVTEYKEGSDGRMNGTFDISFGDQSDKVTGSFSADFCDLSSVSQFTCE